MTEWEREWDKFENSMPDGSDRKHNRPKHNIWVGLHRDIEGAAKYAFELEFSIIIDTSYFNWRRSYKFGLHIRVYA
jgi:hypothetical protein